LWNGRINSLSLFALYALSRNKLVCSFTTQLIRTNNGGNNYGVVKMKEEVTKYWDDLNGHHPWAIATLYVYCDKCGSFSIKSYIGVRKWLLIITACGIMTAGTIGTSTSSQPSGVNWVAVFVCLAICVLAFKFLWGDADYGCRKCGSEPTTDCDTLNYSSSMGILDVPDRFIQRRYFGYFPESHDLSDALKPPQQLPPEQASALDVTSERLDKGTITILCMLLLLILFVILRFAG
jgi:hypothetical protein